jgi:hypothetical protein
MNVHLIWTLVTLLYPFPRDACLDCLSACSFGMHIGYCSSTMPCSSHNNDISRNAFIIIPSQSQQEWSCPYSSTYYMGPAYTDQ